MSDPLTITRHLANDAGYAGQQVADQIPACSVEDVDIAMHRALSSDIGLSVIDPNGVVPVRVVFAAGERWSQVKRGAALRDANGSLILPIVAIVRSGISHDATDVVGRGINQQTGKIAVRRRLSKSRDNSLQRLTNRVGLTDASAWSAPSGSRPLSRRSVGSLRAYDRNVQAGGALRDDISANVLETTYVPAPQFVTISYEIKIWTAYTTQMNQITDRIVSCYLPHDRAIRLSSPKGYWFIAYVEDDGFSYDGNADSLGDDERLIRASMKIRVPAYIIATAPPGAKSSSRVSLSNPSVSFDMPEVSDADAMSDVEAPFLGSDDPTLPRTVSASRRRDIRDDGSGNIGATWRRDPALNQLRRGEKLPRFKRDRIASIARIDDRFVRSSVVSATSGETSYSGFDLADFELAVD